MNWQPELNDLVREAFDAQEAFDNWDNGKTFYDKVFGGPRFCTLQAVVDELDAANLKLVRFVLEHGSDLVAALSASAGEAGTAKTEGLGPKDEHAAPEGGDAQ